MPSSNIPYADPGFNSAGRVPLLPLDTAGNIQTAWTACLTITGYTPDQLDRIKSAISAAASRLRITLGDKP